MQRIYLYGSRAKQTAGERSDIDLAIECPDATVAQWQEVMEIVRTADTLLKIDCVRLDALAHDAFWQSIMKNKQLLFERKQTTYDWYERWLDLQEAVEKLGLVSTEHTSYAYASEATIQIFEYTFELFWKTLKQICAQEGYKSDSPRSTLEPAYALGLIDQENVWLAMLNDRNETSNTYRLPTAHAIVSRVHLYVPAFKMALAHIKQRYAL